MRSLNDAINGIMLSDAEDKENIALGLIPNGIGNDFAKYWGLSTEYKKITGKHIVKNTAHGIEDRKSVV